MGRAWCLIKPIFTAMIATGALSGCSAFFTKSSSAGNSEAEPLVFESVDKIEAGEAINFSIRGGTPPYQVQLDGQGTIDLDQL